VQLIFHFQCGETPDTSLRVNRLTEGKEYKFRVKAVNRQGESKPLTMDHSIIAKNPWDAPGKPQDVKVVDWEKVWCLFVVYIILVRFF
jgi:hypothetical protein